MVLPKSAFTKREWELIQNLRTPAQVQRFLSNLAYNYETEGPTCMSFRSVIRKGRAHCLEGALVAATILEQHGYEPLLVSIESRDKLDHVLFLYKRGGRFGSVARSRDIGLHGRKPVFRTVRDLVMSYYDPYIDKTGCITGYAVADLRDLGSYDWRFSEKNVWKVERYLQEIPHRPVRASMRRYRKWYARYQEFKRQVPDGSPDYFPNRNVWML
ncbi:MAG TPA: hypothetical protein VNO14_16890 [Blastocatellia bacterium]|nr:hypothetical protein [Blastocatellia bacterium]